MAKTQRPELDDVEGIESSAEELTELLLGSIRVALGAGVIAAAVVSDVVRRTTGSVPTAVAVGAALGAMIEGASLGVAVVRRGWTALR